MKIYILLVCIVFSKTLFGQTAKSSDQVRKSFKGASFKQQIKRTRSIFFSNLLQQDTIYFVVDTGLISNSQSHLTIKNFEGHTIFYESFKTHYFVKEIFQPDSIPQGGQDIYESFLEKYIISIPKRKFEVFANEKIKNFLKDVLVSRSEIKQLQEAGTIKDKELYKNVIADKNSKIIWLPCFECDEGVRYFVYSKIKRKATIFLETD